MKGCRHEVAHRIDARLRDDVRLLPLYDLIDRKLKAHGSIWLIGKTLDFGKTEAELRMRNIFNAYEDLRVLQIHQWLNTHARQDGTDTVYYSREGAAVGSHFLPE